MNIRSNGFTLLEMVVAVAIAAILAAIAVPSYIQFVVRSSRQAAQVELVDLASLQEKIYLNSSAYTANIKAAYNGTTAGGLGRTKAVTTDGKYTLSMVTAVDGQTFIITATPMPGSMQAKDGNLSISESGVRTWKDGSW